SIQLHAIPSRASVVLRANFVEVSISCSYLLLSALPFRSLLFCVQINRSQTTQGGKQLVGWQVAHHPTDQTAVVCRGGPDR
ncbi:MAG TPA: hypothetical protein VGF67_03695, partial [Ktedonobacteraceae bacterium]